ncbi:MULTISPECIES: DUF3717 domain-containing protein [Burkholderiaceae]|jgi:hypothetical protein|uniref:DUF3717 domain-containing protein n=1 Tax=Burkholderiaceae TaxID=119060 RepID=UPI000D06021C|nr:MULTISPECIES: DUF3717 domain-containing protein [Burkholderiaceae]MBU9366411.1 DUF3717 domain-containing protein [Burkholderia multivorans]PRZ43847.1 uncharacterized protein DUF3717 [Paraburkholderia fungorum]
MSTVTIEQIERAINIWRVRHPAPEGTNECPTLCEEARVLADVYALMIVQHQATINVAALTRPQMAALSEALNSPAI